MSVTVLTPTYNRGDLLSRCHDSLCRQSNKDFEWIVVDDGSTDETETRVKSWMVDIICIDNYTFSGKSGFGGFDMLYLKKSNGGKHRALNLGIQKAHGELTLILDSDDYLTDNCIELIGKIWGFIKKDNQLGGIGARKAYFDGRIIGDVTFKTTIDASRFEYRYRHGTKGDLCEIFLTHLLLATPFPEIDGEKFCPESLVWNRISKQHIFRYVTDVVYHCEYLKDGLTNQNIKIRMDSPIASMITYSELTKYDIPFLQRAKAAINYHRFSLCRDRKRPVRGTDMNKPVTLPTISRWWCWTKPLGWLMHRNDLKIVDKA